MEKKRYWGIRSKIILCTVLCVVAVGLSSSLYLYWNLNNANPISQFHARLTAAIQDNSQMEISILATAVASGQELTQLRMQLDRLKREYAIFPQPFLCYAQSMGKGDYVAAAKRYMTMTPTEYQAESAR